MKYKLPQDFSFGSAFSGPQTEGWINPTMENIFERDYRLHPEKYFKNHTVKNDFIHQFKNDIKMAQTLGLDCLRTSIQWSKLMPDGKHVDQKVAAFYNQMIDTMIAHQIEPWLALHHFDMPVWAQDKGGWTSREVVAAFAEYATVAFKLFGDRVKKWFTFNEPIVPIQAGYLQGIHPPYGQNAQQAVQAQWNSLIAHHMCVRNYRQLKLDGQYGAIINFAATLPASQHPSDQASAKWADLVNWRCYADPMFLGKFPAEYEAALKQVNLVINKQPGDEELIKKYTINLFGINFYAPAFSRQGSQDNKLDQDGMPALYTPAQLPFMLMNSSRNWAVYPYALYHSIMELHKLYGKKLIIYVTENGMGVEEEEKYQDQDGQIVDDYRILFFKMHLMFVAKAISEGANVRGFHSWAYIDNWSWLNSYKNRYGSIYLDLKTGQRRYKKSATWWQAVTKTKVIDLDQTIINSPFLKPQPSTPTS